MITLVPLIILVSVPAQRPIAGWPSCSLEGPTLLERREARAVRQAAKLRVPAAQPCTSATLCAVQSVSERGDSPWLQ